MFAVDDLAKPKADRVEPVRLEWEILEMFDRFGLELELQGVLTDGLFSSNIKMDSRYPNKP